MDEKEYVNYGQVKTLISHFAYRNDLMVRDLISRLDCLENKYDSLTSKLGSHSTRWDDHDTVLDIHKECIDSLSDQVDDIENRVDILEEDFEEKVEGFETAIYNLSLIANTLFDRISILEDKQHIKLTPPPPKPSYSFFSCRDALPEYGQICIVMHKESGDTVIEFGKHISGGLFEFVYDNEQLKHFHCLYWAPLPAKPEDDND